MVLPNEHVAGILGPEDPSTFKAQDVLIGGIADWNEIKNRALALELHEGAMVGTQTASAGIIWHGKVQSWVEAMLRPRTKHGFVLLTGWSTGHDLGKHNQMVPF